MKMTRLQRSEFGKIVPEPLSYSAKTQEYIVKHGYFYSHGYDEEKLADKVKQAAAEAKMSITVTSTTNHWNAWPRDSWFEVRFRVQDENGNGVVIK
jgi:hypothetical protein